MKKGMKFMALAAIITISFGACNTATLEGTWIEPAAEDSNFGEYGFTLEKGGKVTPINMGYREYNAWEKNDDQLILKGDYTGTNPRTFADTLWIESVTKDELILKDFGNYTVTYQRKKAQ